MSVEHGNSDLREEIRELALNGAVTEIRLLLDEMRERARSQILQMDHELEQTRVLHQEARKILSEVTEDRRRLLGILQRVEAILGLLERHYDMVTHNHMGLGEDGEKRQLI